MEVSIKVKTKGKIVKRIDVKHGVEKLGVRVSPCLSWKDEFERAKFEMKRSIENSIIARMKLHQMCLHFNTRTLTNAFFGCGIVNFNKK